MTQNEINKAVEQSLQLYGRAATIAALNHLFRSGMITAEQVLAALDTLNA